MILMQGDNDDDAVIGNNDGDTINGNTDRDGYGDGNTDDNDMNFNTNREGDDDYSDMNFNSDGNTDGVEGGPRLKSLKEQATEQIKKPLRHCWKCNKKTTHDSCNCDKIKGIVNP
ncbi:hypothetical protein CASFOL_031905 [Castilleja foliolosa]|uniref:Uncharacterized protein n=1 Tax=Castilleja foliolosa TaxID=1961234 RepID=A0ABD3C0W4_9LAMI